MARARRVALLSSAIVWIACGQDPAREWIGFYLGSYESVDTDCSGEPVGTPSLAGFEVEIASGAEGLILHGFPCPIALTVEDETAASAALTACSVRLADGRSAHYTIQPARVLRSGGSIEFTLEWEARADAECQRGVATYRGVRADR